ncbi:MAG: hypothetical protein FWD14_02980 [Treponema sp.]|nr:hypothetical protein [Treponema sp.]
MRLISFLKTGLFIYECFRILILAIILIIQGSEPGLSIRMIFAASAALFPLMALFICIDINRYKTYLPLFAAGKCICIFMELGWSIISRQVTMIGSIDSAAILAQLILSGDLFALAAVFMIIKNVNAENTDIAEEN